MCVSEKFTPLNFALFRRELAAPVMAGGVLEC